MYAFAYSTVANGMQSAASLYTDKHLFEIGASLNSVFLCKQSVEFLHCNPSSQYPRVVDSALFLAAGTTRDSLVHNEHRFVGSYVILLNQS